MSRACSTFERSANSVSPGSASTSEEVALQGMAVRSTNMLVSTGASLILIGVFHFAVWLVSSEPWEGRVSWRKPTLFGLSGGFTLLSMGLLFRHLKPWIIDPLLARGIALAMLSEVALITMQQWRGVPSHFNHSTPFNSLVEVFVTILILFVAVGVSIVTFRSFTQMQCDADVRIAWQGGLLFLLASCGIGLLLLGYGITRTQTGADPEVFGNEGVVKFPHGIAIHAIQIFPCIGWFLRRFHVEQHARTNALLLCNASMACLLGLSISQTLAGRSRWDLNLLSMLLLTISFALLLPVVRYVFRRTKQNAYSSPDLSA